MILLRICIAYFQLFFMYLVKWVYTLIITYSSVDRIGPQCFVDSLLALWKNDIEKINSTTDQEIINDINTITKKYVQYFYF